MLFNSQAHIVLISPPSYFCINFHKTVSIFLEAQFNLSLLNLVRYVSTLLQHATKRKSFITSYIIPLAIMIIFPNLIGISWSSRATATSNPTLLPSCTFDSSMKKLKARPLFIQKLHQIQHFLLWDRLTILFFWSSKIQPRLDHVTLQYHIWRKQNFWGWSPTGHDQVSYQQIALIPVALCSISCILREHLTIEMSKVL